MKERRDLLVQVSWALVHVSSVPVGIAAHACVLVNAELLSQRIKITQKHAHTWSYASDSEAFSY